MDYQISVIIPVYDVEEYISECIESIINQTLGIENIELIIVNDCTPDNSMEIVEEYASKYPSIKIVEHEQNQGPGIARNSGLKHVTADYVTFMDSDDLISENTYETLLKKFVEYDCDLVIYKYKLFSESKNEYPIDIHQEIYKKTRLIEDIKDVPEIIFATSPCNKIYPKKLIPFLNFPKKLYEDNVVAAEISFNSKRIFITDECTYFYRIRECGNESRTQKINKNRCVDLTDINVQLYQLIESYPDYREMITWLNLQFARPILHWMMTWGFSNKEQKQIFNNSKIFLKNISPEDIKKFNNYFPDHKLNNSEIEIISDARDKSFRLFSFKYEHYLPARKKFRSFKTKFIS